MDAKISRWKFNEKYDIVSKYLPTSCFLFIKEKNSDFTVEKPSRHLFNTSINN